MEEEEEDEAEEEALLKSSYGCSWKNMIQTTQYPSSLFSNKIFLFLGMQTLESSIQRHISKWIYPKAKFCAYLESVLILAKRGNVVLISSLIFLQHKSSSDIFEK
ncbi:hypothetical protein ABKV19_011359 [Rosa sericea]